ncbi:MAG: metallophosphoesterase family protein [Armatimonadota bacterium]|nr:MAG: metallophosphoesterase family protein [Armatimonadota bacterium]
MIYLFATMLVIGAALLWLLGRRAAAPSAILSYQREIALPRLPPRCDGLRLLHISDLHLTPRSDSTQAVLDRAQAARPDLIAVTGDLASGWRGLPLARRLLEQLASRWPTYVVPGNADHWADRFDRHIARWGETGARLLINDAQQLCGDGERDARSSGASADCASASSERTPSGANSGAESPSPGLSLRGRGVVALPSEPGQPRHPPGDGEFWVVGVDDPYRFRDDPGRALAQVPAGAFKLLLAHSPEVIRRREALSADLILAGHTHGGQVRLPVIGALLTRSRLGRKWSRGTFRLGGTVLILTTGVGTTRLGVRFCCPPEMTLWVLRGQ